MSETLQISFPEVQKIFSEKSQIFNFLEIELNAREDFYLKYTLFVRRKTDKKVFSSVIRLTKTFHTLKEEESYVLVETQYTSPALIKQFVS